MGKLFGSPLQIIVDDDVIVLGRCLHLACRVGETSNDDVLGIGRPAAQPSLELIERRWCYEDELRLWKLPEHLEGTLHVDLEQDGVARGKVLLDGRKRRTIVIRMDLGPLDEAVFPDDVLKLVDAHEVVVNAVDLTLAGCARRGRYGQDVIGMLFEHAADERALTRSGWTRYDVERTFSHASPSPSLVEIRGDFVKCRDGIGRTRDGPADDEMGRAGGKGFDGRGDAALVAERGALGSHAGSDDDGIGAEQLPHLGCLDGRADDTVELGLVGEAGKALHLLSFLLTLLGVVLVLVLALTLLIPELVQSFHSLYLQIEANIPRWTAYLHAQDPDMGWLMSRLEGIDWEQLLHKVTSGLDTVLVNAAGAVSATVNLVVTASFALIISVYLSLGAQSLGHQARTLVRAYLKPGHAAWVLKFCRLFRQSFANFLTGQCSEAVILGMLMSLAFSLFRIPYGSLVGMLTAICAIIPYVGALLSCVISVFLVLLVDPLLAVRALLVYLAVQFIENQFIYPRVVGKSVGLSPLYTLVAAMIGGKLFGILGILFFIPLTAVVLELVKEDVCRRLRTKETLQ